MKWQTCFNSECYNGYSISLVKSAMQKFLRRRLPSEMKWCVGEIYKFKTMASNEIQIKLGKPIITNLLLLVNLLLPNIPNRPKIKTMLNQRDFEKIRIIIYTICSVIKCVQLERDCCFGYSLIHVIVYILYYVDIIIIIKEIIIITTKIINIIVIITMFK